MPTLSAVARQRPARKAIDLEEAVEAFLSARDLRPRSRAVYATTLSRLVAHLSAKTPLAEITGEDLGGFLADHYGMAAPSTWNLNRAALRSFFAFCSRQGFLGADPSAGLERRVVRTNPDTRVIPAHQLDALWRRDDIALREKTFWRLAYDTAARADELLRLDVSDLDLDAKAAVVVGKGGIPRQVDWYTHTAHLLARLTSGRNSGPVFLSERAARQPVPHADRDPETGRARLSYRRAAECFNHHGIDPPPTSPHPHPRAEGPGLSTPGAPEDHRAPIAAHPHRALPRAFPRGGAALVCRQRSGRPAAESRALPMKRLRPWRRSAG